DLCAAVHESRATAGPGGSQVPGNRTKPAAGTGGNGTAPDGTAIVEGRHRRDPHDRVAAGGNRPVHKPPRGNSPGTARGPARPRPRHRTSRHGSQEHQHRARSAAADGVRARGPVAQEPEEQSLNARSLKILAVIVVALFAAMFALNSGEHGDKADDTGLLFPELKARLNDLNSVTIEDAEGEITLRREEQEESAAGRWIVPEHDNFPADTGKLRQLLLALADARKLERKTSD